MRAHTVALVIDTSKDVETIARLESERFDAVLAGDADKLAALCHPRLSYTHTNGATDTYESYLRKCREGAWDFHRIDHPIHRIEVVGDTAVVLGEMTADFTSGGVEKHLDNVTLAVWSRDGVDWRLLAMHPTPKSTDV
ncbi:nuclear transport factor 2 family protein [Nocardia terpenica]|uniref:DUF4440 domain-containing protein n=1 Tax=Nocardia terpenica TaxID=455432 RepID=A0A6G9Z654_9NOCA|nr:nuclear transport factor 2 family protein [Nocardia terpenica]QIS20972.1 DUF4440 domain-containing protein [Nocardia terpenica]